MILRGYPVAIPGPGADWTQTDPTRPDYIRGREQLAGDLNRAMTQVIPLERGGHGGTTAEQARANLGAVSREQVEEMISDALGVIENGTY